MISPQIAKEKKTLKLDKADRLRTTKSTSFPARASIMHSKYLVSAIFCAFLFFFSSSSVSQNLIMENLSESEIEAFKALALRVNTTQSNFNPPPNTIIKWNKNSLAIRFHGNGAERYSDEFMNVISSASQHTDIEFSESDSEADVEVIFFDSASEVRALLPIMRQASNTREEHLAYLTELEKPINCHVKSRTNEYVITKSVVLIYSRSSSGIVNICMNITTLMFRGVMGMQAEPFESSMNYNQYSNITPLDRKILEILYHPNLEPGSGWSQVTQLNAMIEN